jgi:2,4-dienoyl-CoA reductase (NADPH2)
VDYQKIDDQGLHISAGGAPRLLEVDHIVLCAGQESLTELMPLAGDASTSGPKFHRIGGAALAAELDAKRAIREGTLLASSW